MSITKLYSAKNTAPWIRKAIEEAMKNTPEEAAVAAELLALILRRRAEAHAAMKPIDDDPPQL
jgi:hypothetical protein